MGQSWQKKGIDRLQIESSVAHHLGKPPHFQKGCKISERHRKVVEGMDIYRTEKKNASHQGPSERIFLATGICQRTFSRD